MGRRGDAGGGGKWARRRGLTSTVREHPPPGLVRSTWRRTPVVHLVVHRSHWRLSTPTWGHTGTHSSTDSPWPATEGWFCQRPDSGKEFAGGHREICCQPSLVRDASRGTAWDTSYTRHAGNALRSRLRGGGAGFAGALGTWAAAAASSRGAKRARDPVARLTARRTEAAAAARSRAAARRRKAAPCGVPGSCRG